ncbi:maleylacetate reductase [Brevibacterium marinum]|uniref:Maleylacetate reductase n=1 Tax=Brevibacterium marinum TaxID=418643 RepID=A0A846S2U3_9MICO|nr:maleylacetate reductase [Brevibacterium marinum]NJC58476.1 maleylacetate reductase [Brevibacterium marinum]
MSLDFAHITLGQRVLFGSGRAAEHLVSEVDRLDASKPLVVASGSAEGKATRITSDLEIALWWSEVVMHVPAEVADRAVDASVEHAVDLVISVGGGSATGLAKAIALATGIPIIAVPTTFSGSEATNVWGRTENARKRTGVDERVLPVSVVYDADLLTDLPSELAISSGMNALAHCVDSLWAPKADPINQALAIEAVRVLGHGLPAIRTGQAGGLEHALYGAYLAAVAFASAGSGMHHKIAHVLGGTFNLPHAQTHATILPYVLAFNAPAAPEAEARMAGAFGTASAAEGLENLRSTVGAPTALNEIGFTEDGIPEAVKLSLATIPENNPRPATEEGITALLTAALRGTDPAALSLPDIGTTGAEPSKG